jgi:hypothetical protein
VVVVHPTSPSPHLLTQKKERKKGKKRKNCLRLQDTGGVIRFLFGACSNKKMNLKNLFMPLIPPRLQQRLAEANRFQVGSGNAGSLTGKLRELVDAAIRRRENISCVEETRWAGQKAKEVENTCFKLWYSRSVDTTSSVGVLTIRASKRE